MTRDTFDQVIRFLEGFYEREFSPNALEVAWGIFSTMEDRIVGMGARRMAEAAEEKPSPMVWLRYVKLAQAEEAQAAKTQETEEAQNRLRLTGTVPRGDRRAARPRGLEETDAERRAYLREFVGTPDVLPGDCHEYIALCLKGMGAAAPVLPRS